MYNKTKIKEFCSPWISDSIGDDYKQWLTKTDLIKQASKEGRLSLLDNSHIFIESATGTGKTSFILDKLLPHAQIYNRNILYISNRTALLQQVENELRKRHSANLIEDIIYYSYDVQTKQNTKEPTYKSFNLGDDYFHIALCNYQSLKSFFKLIPANNFYYIIFDEIHFFLEDALFNAYTYQIFYDIIPLISQSVIIMMSATMQDIQADFADSIVGYSWDRASKNSPVGVPNTARDFNVFIYRNTYKRPAYMPLFYHNPNILIEKIDESNPREKWLIFVTSKKIGNEMLDAINNYTSRNATFLDASKKNNSVWKKLVTESEFDDDVLITTKVMDNGVNINDQTLKNIVLPFCDYTEFVQMLGRKRLEPNEKITVYVQIPESETIRKKKQQNERLYKAITLFLLKTQPNQEYTPRQIQEYKTRQLQIYWAKADINIMRLFFIDYERNLCPNLFAYMKLKNLNNFYDDLLTHEKETAYFGKVVNSWVGLSEEQKPRLTTFFKSTSLKELIKKMLNEPIPEEEQEVFYKDFQFLYKNECKKTFANDDIEYQKALSVRKGKTQRKATMNRELAILNLPYEFIKRENRWILQEIKPETAENT